MRNHRGFLAALLLMFLCTFQPAHADRFEKLLDLLQKKGILSVEEASALREQIEEEDANVQPTPAKNEGKQADLASSYVGAGEKIKFSGDLRLRGDIQNRDFSPESDDLGRYRPRFRLRFGVEAEPFDNTKVGMRLASGSGFQNTTNQSFDDHGRGKMIFIDRAYARWSPVAWFRLTGGKHKNPFLTSPLVWDEDVNLEGASEVFTTKGEKIQFFANMTQFIINEVGFSTDQRDPWMLGFQGGTSIRSGSGNRLELGVTYYDFLNLDLFTPKGLGDRTTFHGYNNAHGQQMIYDAAGNLLNEFRTWELSARFSIKDLAPLPISLFGTYVKNLAADIKQLQRSGITVEGSDPGALLAYGNDNRDQGFLFGADVGYKGQKGDVSAEYFYQRLEDYAFPAVFTDSDFHSGGTNNRGHRARINYFLTNKIYLRGTFFFTSRDNEAKDGRFDEQRTLLDLVFAF